MTRKESHRAVEADAEKRSASSSRRSRAKPSFDPDRCKSCGICIAFCPKQALREGPGGVPELADPEACNSCELCAHMCPDFAVQMEKEPAADEDRDGE